MSDPRLEYSADRRDRVGAIVGAVTGAIALGLLIVAVVTW